MDISKNSAFSIIIPTLNEGKCIGKVLKDLKQEYNCEIIIVDGNSSDNTVEVAKREGATVIIQEGKGFGNAIKTGLKIAKGEIIVCMDGDGSQEIKDIRKLVNLVESGQDIAFGSRYMTGGGSKDDTLIRYIGNKFFTKIINLLFGVRISDTLYFYFAIRKKKMELLDLRTNGFEFCVEVPIKVHTKNLKYTEIPCFESPRLAGESKINAFYHGLIILFFVLKFNYNLVLKPKILLSDKP